MITCHTIFIAVTHLLMGPPDPSEPDAGSVISPVSLFIAPSLQSSVNPVLSHPQHYTQPLLFLSHPLTLFLISLIFFLFFCSHPHPLSICPCHPPHTSTGHLPPPTHTHTIIDSLVLLSHRHSQRAFTKVTDLASNRT